MRCFHRMPTGKCHEQMKRALFIGLFSARWVELFSSGCVCTAPQHLDPMLQAVTHETVPTVLFIDDEPGNRLTFKAAFRKEFNVLLAESLEAAWPILERQDVHVVICDQRMPVVMGSEALCQIKARFPRVRRMLITAYADLQTLVDALNNAGVCHYIQKPWEVQDVLAAVKAAWAAYQQENEQAAYTEKLLESNRQLEFALRQSLLS